MNPLKFRITTNIKGLVRLFFVILLMSISLMSLAQNSIEEQQISEMNSSVKTLDRAQWKELADKADYFKKEKQEENIVRDKPSGEMDLGFLKYLMIGIAIALIVFILLKVFATEIFKSSKKNNKTTQYTLEDIESNLNEVGLKKLLIDAIESKDYKLAIRIYYLIILQNLNQKKLIKWHKEKTNAHYLREMRSHLNFKEFKFITTIFEHVWYGETLEVSQQSFNSVELMFNDFINKIERA